MPSEIFDLQQLAAWTPPPNKPIIDKGVLLEHTKMVLFGGPKLGKSIVAQQLSFSLTYFQDWLGFKTNPSSVLYLQAEIPRAEFRNRIMKMHTNFLTIAPIAKLRVGNIFGIKLDQAMGMKELNQIMTPTNANPSPEVLIIDPMYRVITERNDDALTRFFDNIDDIINRFNTTVVIIHHERKLAQSQRDGSLISVGVQDMRDSRLIEAFFDSIIQLQGDPQTDQRRLTFELRNAEKLVPPRDLLFDRNKLWFNVVP